MEEAADPEARRARLRLLPVGAFLVLLSVYLSSHMAGPSGIGISPDSVDYLSAASSLASEGRFRDYLGEPYAYWPPLVPALLALIRQLGLDPVATAPYVQGFFIGLAAAASLALTFQLSRSAALAGLVGLVVALSTMMAQLAGWLSSEPIFTFFLVAIVLATTRYVRRPGLARLSALGALCALALLSRYAGASLVLGASLAIALHGRGSPWRLGRHLALLWAISFAPVGLWLARNVVVTGTMSGERHFSWANLPESAALVARELATWFIPAGFDDGVYVAGGAGLLALCIGFVLLCVASPRKDILRDLSILSIFVVAYSAFIVYTLLTACCVLRFMAPVHPVVIVLLAVTGVAIWRRLAAAGPVRRFLVRGALLTALLFLAVLNTIGTSVVMQRAHDHGLGYNARAWRGNSLIEYLEARPLPDDACIFTNAPDAVWYFLRTDCVAYGPRKGILYHEDVRVDDRAEVIARMRSAPGERLFVWFEGVRTREIRRPEELRARFELEELLRTDDGVIYRLARPD